MGFFPNLTNFESYVSDELNKRVGNIEYVSSKNCWFKIASGVSVKYQTETFRGLVMESNPPELWNFAENEKSAYGRLGSENTSFLSGQALSGTIGHQLGDPTSRVQVSGRYYRPRPSIESISIKNGTRGLSRQAELQIKCYSLDQLEVISKFFLEPGNVVFMEWGWNSPDSAAQSILYQNDRSKVISDIIDQFDYSKLEKRRKASNGTYDNFVSYITGGDIQSSGDSYIMSVKLTSVGELAAYLRTQKGKNDENDSSGLDNDLKYKEDDIDDDSSDGAKQFKIMFNSLPSRFQTNSVKSLLNVLGTEDNLVNFDKSKTDKILSGKSTKAFLAGIGAAIASPFTSNNVGREDAAVYGTEEIISPNRYIRMGALMKLISTASGELSVTIGDRVVSNLYVDIDGTRLSAFDRIFSINKDILYIPNQSLPDFGLRRLIQNVVTSANTYSTINEDILKRNNTVDASLGNVRFPEPSGNDQTEQRWGYLKNLFVDFDYAMQIINKSNLSQTDWLYELLNGISSAVNNIWDFEIIERINDGSGLVSPQLNVDTISTFGLPKTKDQDANSYLPANLITVQVIDRNYGRVLSSELPYGLYNIGEQSILLDGSFNLDIPGAMMNQIIAKRSADELDVNIEGSKYVDGLFVSGNEVDALKLTYNERLPKNNDETLSNNKEKNEESNSDPVKFSLFTKKMGIFPKQLQQDNGSDSNDSNSIIRDVIAVTYDNDILFRKIYNESVGGVEENTSILLPIKFNFKIHGISGIKVGDKFRILDLPQKYSTSGVFQVTDISNELNGMQWTTTVEGQFRRNR